MRQLRLWLWALAALAAVVAGALLLRPHRDVQAGKPIVAASPGFGGPFSLVDSAGRPFGTEQLKGKPYALYFGFTHCPDTCPMTLSRLVKLRRALGKGDDNFNIVFVTVDPERDGPKEMDAYSKAFGGPIIGLTGSVDQIAKVEKQHGVYAQKVPTGDGDYTMDHTAVVLLFDSEGKFVATLAPDEQDPAALAKLKRITA